jgi:4-aminobutyrate aminotransferase-like enzyme
VTQQGVGGFITPPPGYFERIIPMVREAGGLFIADEVQTGWGRTGGKWFGVVGNPIRSQWSRV